VATCGDKGICFIKGDAEVGVRKVKPKAVPRSGGKAGESQGEIEYNVTVNGKDYWMVIEGSNVTVNGKLYHVHARKEARPAADRGESPGTPVVAQMPGVVLRLLRRQGERVAAGDPLIVLEAMKMEVEITAPVGGTLEVIAVSAEQHVSTGQLLASIR